MLASRLLSILMLLQTRGRLSAKALAAEFEVSERTILRDIDQLSAAGVPVYANRGRTGGFELLDGYRTNLTGLTQPEAEALFLAGLPGPAAQLGLADALEKARLKIVAALPSKIQPDAERIASRFHLDPVAWFHDGEPPPALQIVARGVWSGHHLRLKYRNNGAIYGRKLGPLGLVLKSGVWYLVAQSGSSVRTYRVAQILEPEITEEPYDRPADFDLGRYWSTSTRAYEAGTYRAEADIRLSSKGWARLNLLGPYVTEAAKKTRKPDRQGWVRCRVPIETGEAGLRDLLRLGNEVEVIAPAEFREQMAALLASMLGRHASRRRRAR